jgi:hypothetical protein
MAKDIGADSTEAFADIRMTSDNGFLYSGIMSYWNFRIQNRSFKGRPITG